MKMICYPMEGKCSIIMANYNPCHKNSLKKFLHKCNVIVNILPYTKATQHMINKSFLQAMKKESLLISVGRGSTLNEKDLITHLKKIKIFMLL